MIEWENDELVVTASPRKDETGIFTKPLAFSVRARESTVPAPGSRELKLRRLPLEPARAYTPMDTFYKWNSGKPQGLHNYLGGVTLKGYKCDYHSHMIEKKRKVEDAALIMVKQKRAKE